MSFGQYSDDDEESWQTSPSYVSDYYDYDDVDYDFATTRSTNDGRMSHPLGVALNDGIMVMVEMGARLPVSRTVSFLTTDVDRSVGVYAGDSPYEHENVLLGELWLRELPLDVGPVYVEVTMHVDAYGHCSVGIECDATHCSGRKLLKRDHRASPDDLEIRRWPADIGLDAGNGYEFGNSESNEARTSDYVDMACDECASAMDGLTISASTEDQWRRVMSLKQAVQCLQLPTHPFYFTNV